jgi:hypothetical protein
MAQSKTGLGNFMPARIKLGIFWTHLAKPTFKPKEKIRWLEGLAKLLYWLA